MNTGKKKKSFKKRLVWIIPLAIFALFLGYIVVLAWSDANFVRSANTNLDFSRVMRDNVPLDARIIDIAMLGAHNTFSHAITRRSPIDPNDNSAPAQHPILLTLAPGTFARLGRTQISDTAGLLRRGVRYLDARISYADGWYTENTLLSAHFSDYLRDTIIFLQENPGELVIFDIYGARLGDAASFDDLWDFIGSFYVNGQTLFDFVHNMPYYNPLHEITLGDATQDGQSGGVIILARAETEPGSFYYNRGTNVRRRSHSQQQTSGSIERINAEHNYLLQGDYDNLLRVSQAQLQPTLWGSGIVDTLLRWSYIRINAVHNSEIIDYEHLPEWLTTTPVMMFGITDTPRGNFNERIIEIINEFNRSL